MNSVGELIGCVVKLPLVGCAPNQPFSGNSVALAVPVQLVASVVVQLSVLMPPNNTRGGVAVSVMTGTGEKLTVVLALPEPPLPVQLIE